MHKVEKENIRRIIIQFPHLIIFQICINHLRMIKKIGETSANCALKIQEEGEEWDENNFSKLEFWWRADLFSGKVGGCRLISSNRPIS